MATVVGKNDTGKSSILRAIQLFFDESEIDEEDINDEAADTDNMTIEIAFCSLPQRIRIERGVGTTLKQEMLVDNNGLLRIRKTYSKEDAKFKVSLITQDYQQESFAGLAKIKEPDLNDLCRQNRLDSTRSGRGIRNKDKREALRDLARRNGVPLGKHELELSRKDDLWKIVEHHLPRFYLFEAETSTDIRGASFQREFRPIVATAAGKREVVKIKNKFAGALRKSLQDELNLIFEKLQKYTEDVTSLTAKPDFSWDKAVEFQIYGKDRHGIDKPLEKRGSGIRRLLMVAFFEHLAEKHGKETNCIFGIEEPENNLHPGLQRDLVNSFKKLVEQGYQIAITTHSPVFAGSSPVEDLTLIVRESGVSRAIQLPQLSLFDVANELGIEPSDQIMGYDACAFVEGSTDVIFWKNVAAKLKVAGVITADLDDKNIGVIPVGGDNLKCWMNLVALQKLTRRFAIVVDSDRKSQNENTKQRKLNWKAKCEAVGGIFICTRKREVENYLHRDAIRRSGKPLRYYNDFSDMKELFGKNVVNVVENMTADEILQMDSYEENGTSRHELKEAIEKLLSLVPD